jgi:hypothetical protein
MTFVSEPDYKNFLSNLINFKKNSSLSFLSKYKAKNNQGQFITGESIINAVDDLPDDFKMIKGSIKSLKKHYLVD